MTTGDTRAVLDKLIARRGNAPEFTLELEGYANDLAGGNLDSADIKYIHDLEKRLDNAAAVPIKAPAEDNETDDDSRFSRAKAAFRERFHPDMLNPNAPDAAVRREIYEEFWAELERIEDTA